MTKDSLHTMWVADVASKGMGMQLDSAEPGSARTRMVVTPAMINGHGVCHGGYIFALADTAFAFASNGNEGASVAATCEIVFVRPACLGDELVANASERVRFGRNGVYDVTVCRADGDVVAEFRGQSRTVAGRELP
jgi:acyl-CoA thioesterase